MDTNTLQPNGFAQMLQGQQQPEAATPQIPQMEDTSGGMTEAVMGPGLFERGRSLAQNNPAMAQMLLHTFMTMAQSSGKGLAQSASEGVAGGANAVLMGQAEERQRADAQRKEDTANAKDERNFGVTKANSDSANALRSAQTDAAVQTAQRANEMQPMQMKALQLKMDGLKESIRNSTDSRKTAELQRRLQGLQIAAQEFANDEKKATAPYDRLKKGLEVQDATVKGAAARQAYEDLSTLTPEQRLARGSGAPKQKSERELFVDFVNKNGDMFENPETGRFDMSAAVAEWEKGSPEGQQRMAEGNAQFSVALERARNSVKIGEIYTRPDGQLARRKN